MDSSFCRGTYTNSFFAEVGGIPVEELNRLEVEFLTRIDYRLNLQPWEIEQGLQGIASRGVSATCFYCSRIKYWQDVYVCQDELYSRPDRQSQMHAVS